jgi:tRNA pseudouridine32 synthase / 23S rRNA pseudouridine746 synthase
MHSKSGISPSKVFLPQDDLNHQTVLDFLIHQFPAVSKDEWISRMKDGLVFDADRTTLDVSSPYQPNSFIYYFKRVQSEECIPFKEKIIYQDDHLLIADKPHFLPVTPGGHYLEETLLVRLKRLTGIDTLSPIHRIDRETAGLVAFAKLPEDRNAYQALFRDRAVKKVYEAIAPYKEDLVNRFPIHYQSRIKESDVFIQMQEVSGEPNSESTIDLIEVSGSWAKYQLLLGTGKKHQLRLHMSGLGLPIKHDQIYPNLRPHVVVGKDFTQPLQLLAKELSFIDPITSLHHSFLTQQALQL